MFLQVADLPLGRLGRSLGLQVQGEAQATGKLTNIARLNYFKTIILFCLF